MQSQSDPKKSLQDKLKNKYRIVVLDDDTLGEVRVARITGYGILGFVVIALLIAAVLTSLLICFTPLRHLVPGYADITNNKAYAEMHSKLEEIEKELDAQRVYTTGFKNLLNPSGISIENGDHKDQARTISDGDKGSSIITELGMEHYYFHSPIRGEISAGFDLDDKHFGVDIVAEKDTPVQSIQDGVVINADWSFKTGNSITIQHKNEVISVYKHNSKLLKKVGQMVKAGEAIAIIGNTGELTNGPHVHIELWKDGIAVDPVHYLNFD